MNPPKNMSQLTVVICTHNPKEEFIQETLAALRAQTAPLDAWDLLVIDNASTVPLDRRLDLSWHPGGRIIREESLGTAHARLRSLRELKTSPSSLILFVDDDNILAPDYIAQGLALEKAWPQLGCWGGQLVARYETEPPEWLENYKKYFAILPLDAPLWTNRIHSYDMVPPTAGCFVRRAVWEKYLQLVADSPLRLTLGARGQEQARGEDTDLILSAIDIGLGVGRFPQLSAEHIMPAGRITVAYLENLIAGVFFGTGVLEFIRQGKIPRPVGKHWLDRQLIRRRARRLPAPISNFYQAELRGREKARALVLDWQKQPPSASERRAV
jgi:glycosyltransferase involved in cell wall biosynthesis